MTGLPAEFGDVKPTKSLFPAEFSMDQLPAEFAQAEPAAEQPSGVLDYLGDIPKLVNSLIVGPLEPVAETVARPFFGEPAVQAIRQFASSVSEPRTKLGQLVLSGAALPFTKAHEAVKAGLVAMGRDEQTAEQHATAVLGALGLGLGAKGVLKPKPIELDAMKIYNEQTRWKAERDVRFADNSVVGSPESLAGLKEALNRIDSEVAAKAISKVPEGKQMPLKLGKLARLLPEELKASKESEAALRAETAAKAKQAEEAALNDVRQQIPLDFPELPEATEAAKAPATKAAAPVAEALPPELPAKPAPAVLAARAKADEAVAFQEKRLAANKEKRAVFVDDLEKKYGSEYQTYLDTEEAPQFLSLESWYHGVKEPALAAAPKEITIDDIRGMTPSYRNQATNEIYKSAGPGEGHVKFAQRLGLTENDLVRNKSEVDKSFKGPWEIQGYDYGLTDKNGKFYTMLELDAAIKQTGKNAEPSAPQVPVEKTAATPQPRTIPQIEGDLQAVSDLLARENRKPSPSQETIGMLEEREAALIEEYQALRTEEVGKVAPKAADAELESLLNDFEIPEEARAVVEGRLDPTTGEAAPVDVVEVKKYAARPVRQASQDAREGFLAAYKFKDNDSIIQAPKRSELTGQILGRSSAEGEWGWVDPKDGAFVSDAIMRQGPVEAQRVTERMTNAKLAKLLSKLREERGSASDKPLAYELDKDTLSQVRDLQRQFGKVRREAKKAGLSVEEFLRNKGLTQEAIDLYHKVSNIEIEPGELIAKATRWQKNYIHELAQDLNVNHREVAETVGLDKEKSVGKYTYNEAVTLINRLRQMQYTKEGHGLSQMTESELRQAFDVEPHHKYNEILRSQTIREKVKASAKLARRGFVSPETVLNEHPLTAEFFKLADKQDSRKLQHTEYIFSEQGLKADFVDKIAPEGSASSRKIGLALEGRLSLDELTAKEKQALEIHRIGYKHMLDFAVKRYVPNPEREKVVRAISAVLKYSKNEKAAEIDAAIASYKKKYALTQNEIQAVQLLRHEIEMYMPHLHDRRFLEAYMVEQLDTLKQIKQPSEKNRLDMKNLEETLSQLKSGRLYSFNGIPKEIQFGYFKERHGMPGYRIDATVAFHSYVSGWLRKMYDEPVLRQAANIFPQVPKEMQPYLRRFTYDYVGWGERNVAADIIKRFEWNRTLGYNMRAALGDMTQIVNTITDTGITASYRGLKKAMTPAGIAEFKFSGLQREIPQVQYTGEELYHMKFWKNPTIAQLKKFGPGVFFNAAEFALRNHAYHAGMAKAKALGLTGEDAFWYAVDTVHRTQFKYGRVGTPTAMRGWGGVVTQFSSFTVKEFELLNKWRKEPGGMGKIALFLALSTGVKELSDLAGMDLSSYTGLGVHFADLAQTLYHMSDQEWEEAAKEWRMSFAGGQGLFPQSFPFLTGPFLQLVASIAGKDKLTWQKVAGELEPVQALRVRDFVNAMKYRKDGNYPVFKYESPEVFSAEPIELKYNLTLKDTVMRAFGPKPSAETIHQLTELRETLTDQEIKEILTKFDRALLRGDSKEVDRIISKYSGVVAGRTPEQLQNDLLKMELTDEERRLLQMRSPSYSRKRVLLND